MAVKAVKPIADVPFFLVIDNRVTYLLHFHRHQPRYFLGTAGWDDQRKTAKQVYSFTHFDAWAYGTNFFTSRYSNRTITILLRRASMSGSTSISLRQTARARPKSTACSAAPSASTKSSTPKPSASDRCTTYRSKSAWTPTPRTATCAGQARRRRRSAVRV